MSIPIERLPDFPETMNRELALAYTGIGASLLGEYERLGVVNFKPVGPRGSMVVRKADLQRMLTFIFERGDNLPPSEDMEL